MMPMTQRSDKSEPRSLSLARILWGDDKVAARLGPKATEENIVAVHPVAPAECVS